MVVIDWVNVASLVISFLLLMGGAFYAYRIMAYLGRVWWWYLFILSFMVVAVRRLTSLAIEFNLAPALTGDVALFDRVVIPLLNSLLLFIGVYELHRRLKRKL